MMHMTLFVCKSKYSSEYIDFNMSAQHSHAWVRLEYGKEQMKKKDPTRIRKGRRTMHMPVVEWK
jgi:hypothetical protein